MSEADPSAVDRATQDRAAQDRAAQDPSAVNHVAQDRAAQDRFRRLEEIFHQASELQASRAEHEVEAFLSSACGDDPGLLQEIRQMLSLDGDAEHRLDGIVGSALEELPGVGPAADDVPKRIGPYRVLSLLGQGGIGSVYLAERDDRHFHKRVAVKCIRPELGGAGLERRFRFERQVLANLDHPHIARILDGGTHEGMAYIVMELVEGERLLEHCRRLRLDVRAKLELFRKICDAVHYAHRSLILHCDLKPSNILVDGDGEPKLVDFGIAKALQGQTPAGLQGPSGLTEGVALTERGVRPFTPEYASPEQVQYQPLTTGTDVYSLGVVLFELLCDRRPYEMETLSPLDIAQVVTTTEVPSPSSRWRADQGQTRSSQAPWGRDLDAVVGMALRKDSNQRYGSVEQFSDDVLAYLEDRPVQARRDTWIYRSVKLLRRYRWTAAAVLLVATALISATVITSHQAHVAQTERLRAEEHLRTAREERDRGQAVIDLLVGLFEGSDPSQAQGSEITAREVLDQGSDRIQTELVDRPKLRAALTQVMGRVYRELGVLDQAELFLSGSLETLQTELEASSEDVVDGRLQLALLRLTQDRAEDADRLIAEALAAHVQARGASGNVYASLLRAQAIARLDQNRIAEAQDLLQQALDAVEVTTRSDEADRAEALDLLAQAAYYQEDYGEAERYVLLGLEGRRRALGEDHPKVAVSLNNLSAIRRATGDRSGLRGDMEATLALRRRLFGDVHGAVALSLMNLAEIQTEEGDLEQAKAHLEEASSILLELHGPDHNAVGDVLFSRARLEGRLGHGEAASELFRRSLEIRRARLKPGHPDIVLGLIRLGDSFSPENPEKEATYREALAVQTRYGASDLRKMAYALERLGNLLCLEDPAEGLDHLTQALDFKRRTSAPDDWRLAMSEARLGRCQFARDPGPGLERMRAAVAELETRLGPEHPQTVKARDWLAEASSGPSGP